MLTRAGPKTKYLLLPTASLNRLNFLNSLYLPLTFFKKLFFIRKWYFATGDHVFQQITGIPMGSYPAPFFANRFLVYYEWQNINNLKKENVISA